MMICQLIECTIQAIFRLSNCDDTVSGHPLSTMLGGKRFHEFYDFVKIHENRENHQNS